MTKLKARFITSSTLAWLFLIGSVGASAESETLEIGIQGYSPVSYFTRNTAEKGNPAFSVDYGGKRYHLASAQQVEQFKAGPARYLPLFAEFCPYSPILGRHVRIDPTNFKVIGDRLLLFHKRSEMEGLKARNANGPSNELQGNAGQAFMQFRF